MQVVILAAGMGKRLKSKTKNHTKSMVEILGKTFLEHSLDKVTKHDISKIVIVIGYCGDEIKSVIGDNYNGVPVVYVNNEVYATTNNIYSLYLAKDYLEKEDTLLLESDLIYEQKIIDDLISNPYPNLAVVAKYRNYMDGTVVKINENDEITAFISKEHFDFDEVKSYYKTVNIYKFSKEFLEHEYLPFLEAYCSTMGKNSYYEQVLKILLSLEKNSLRVLKLGDEKWYEVDDLQDYDIAECLFCEDSEERLKKYQSRYGGYWRFKGLNDFCYLVNPYFPNKKMIAEMKNNFEDLLINYQSTQSIEDLLASNIFNLKSEHVLVGNGAAELINAFVPTLTGSIGVIIPTFQEYTARLNKSAEVHYLKPNNADFSYTADDLKNFANEIDTLILINPDNPSGNFISKEDLLDLIDFYHKNNKNIVVDESFVDFSEELEENSILHEDIIEKYSNLVIIKSISKSYGVPGIRLGIMATSNGEFRENCAKNLSVWNINSYAEFFLQILNKHKKTYDKACQKIVDNRKEFFEKLNSINYIRPIQSQANYILCEVKAPYNSTLLTKKLLERDILIKDCAAKKGFDNKSYVRIAVKSKPENDYLINILETL